jgi:PAS domain S-box-containing protein
VIQAFGTLLCLDEEFRVRRCGENVARFLGREPEAVIGRPLAALLGEEAAAIVAGACGSLRPGSIEDLGDLGAGLAPGTVALASREGEGGEVGVVLIPGEAGRAGGAGGSPHRVAWALRRAAIEARESRTLEAFCQQVAEAARSLTGYDQVLIQRLDEEAPGPIVAASRRGDRATEAPPLIAPESHARLRRIPIWAVAEVGASPVPIVPRRDAEAGGEGGLLGAPSWAEEQALLEGGMRASLTAAIVVGGRLWGALVGQHGAPSAPGGAALALLGGLAEMLAARITSGLAQDRAEEGRARMAAALRMTQERFDLAVQGSSDGIFDWDLRHDTLYFSPRWKAMLGHEDHEIPNNLAEWEARLHPDDRVRVHGQLHAYLTGREARHENEYRLRARDGSFRWILSRAVARRDASGMPVRVAGSLTDVTERRRSEAALRASEERFRLIAESLEDVFWMCTPDRRQILYISPACEVLWGMPAARFYADPRALLEVILPADRPRVIAATSHPAEAPYELEFRVAREGAAPRWFRSRNYPVRDTSGDIHVVVGTASDITARVLAEEAVRERSEQLATANAKLAKAARLTDEFLANVSHELRTPLSGVLGAAEALEEQVYGPVNADQIAALRDIQQSGRHLLSLINDILDLSKIEAGQVTLEIGPTPVSRVCWAAWRLVKEMAHRKRHRVTTDLDASVGVVLADERRLKQILVNLLGNAIKFTPEGGEIRLEVTGHRDQQTVDFAVRDTGIGILPEHIGLLFRPFQQIDSRLSRQYQGTGLGLALAWRMTALHGGRMQVESEPGLGSCFTVTIPWVPGLLDAAMEASDAPATAPPAPWLAGPLVLLAEDHESNARTTGDFLRASGYQVALAFDGHQLIAKARALLPRVILVDIQMPGVDGLEATRQLRADPATRAIPIVAVTALAMPDDRERCLRAGASGYLTKPLALRELRDLVDRLLTRPAGG